MPGFDEELAFRGIMVGLLVTILIPRITVGSINLGSPAVWVTAILFALIHAFTLDETWSVKFNVVYFSYTFLFGYIMGWMAIKTRSILMPVIAHNSVNFIGTLVTMLK